MKFNKNGVAKVFKPKHIGLLPHNRNMIMIEDVHFGVSGMNMNDDRRKILNTLSQARHNNTRITILGSPSQGKSMLSETIHHMVRNQINQD